MSGQLRQRSVSLRNTLPRFTVPDRARRSVCFRLVRATNTSGVTPRIPAFGDWVRAIRIDRARRRCRRNIDRTAIDEHRVVHPWNLARKQAGIAVKTSSPLRREVVARDRDRPVDRTRRRYARILESLTRWLHKGVEFVAAKHSWNVRRAQVGHSGDAPSGGSASGGGAASAGDGVVSNVTADDTSCGWSVCASAEQAVTTTKSV